MEDIVKYARQRGIRALIEIDSPAHVSNGWQWGPLGGMGDLAICINQQPWRQFCIQPPCGQMNIVNENLYEIMKLIYEDIAKITPGENTMHLGGDEVRGPLIKALLLKFSVASYFSITGPFRVLER